MRLPRVIRKLMVFQIISLCQLITLLCVGSACDYCLAGISSSTPYIQNHGKKLDFSCLSWALPSAPFPAAGRAGAQLGSASHLCLTLTLTHCKTQAVNALGAAGAGSETSFHRVLEPQEENKHSIKAEFLSSNIFPCADHHLLWCLTHAIQHC